MFVPWKMPRQRAGLCWDSFPVLEENMGQSGNRVCVLRIHTDCGNAGGKLIREAYTEQRTGGEASRGWNGGDWLLP